MTNPAPHQGGSPDSSAQAFGLSHVGRLRQRNEDAIWIDPQGRYVILADGMGGHRGGQTASRMAIEHCISELDKNIKMFASGDHPQTCVLTLERIFVRISEAVHNRGQVEAELHDMGTTLVVVTLVGPLAFVAHVGDSRGYFMRDQNCFQVTADHSYENEQLRLGLQRNQIPPHKMKNVIFRNIGCHPPALPNVSFLKSQPQDRWLLCSDGVSNHLNAHQLGLVCEEHKNDMKAMCQNILALAYRGGGEDNLSVIVATTR